jgi:hypothetical protein
MPLSKDVIDKALEACRAIDADVFLYNGTVHRSRDLDCMEGIFQHRGRKKAILILVTHGGDPDAAYKIR